MVYGDSICMVIAYGWISDIPPYVAYAKDLDIASWLLRSLISDHYKSILRHSVA